MPLSTPQHVRQRAATFGSSLGVDVGGDAGVVTAPSSVGRVADGDPRAAGRTSRRASSFSSTQKV